MLRNVFRFVVDFHPRIRVNGYTTLLMMNSQKHTGFAFKGACASRALRTLLGNELLSLLLI